MTGDSTSSSVGPTKSLRRRLFGSHLLVMVVALGVMLLGLSIVVGVYELGGFGGGRGRGRESAPFGLFFGVGAALIASGFVSWWVARRLAAPLETVSGATRQLAAGSYDVHVPPAGTVELDQLALDVNALASELKTSEQRRLRLIGDVAHELRNPLSTIEGTMEALLDGVVEADPDAFARVGREAARLRRLADDLSSLSAAGEFEVSASEELDLAELVGRVVAQLEPQASAKDLRLSIKQSEAAHIRGDSDRLTQVFINVIGNAVQYTAEGDVSVSVRATAGAVTVLVTDTGRGLAPEELSRIFERFHRVDEHYSDGTGVGLAIAKLIVEAHGGRIVAHSDGLGSGSEFQIELPAGRAQSGS